VWVGVSGGSGRPLSPGGGVRAGPGVGLGAPAAELGGGRRGRRPAHDLHPLRPPGGVNFRALDESFWRHVPCIFRNDHQPAVHSGAPGGWPVVPDGGGREVRGGLGGPQAPGRGRRRRLRRRGRAPLSPGFSLAQVSEVGLYLAGKARRRGLLGRHAYLLAAALCVALLAASPFASHALRHVNDVDLDFSLGETSTLFKKRRRRRAFWDQDDEKKEHQQHPAPGRTNRSI
ncbi:unnamed protein product, partial [Heterosigma akashiwo]